VNFFFLIFTLLMVVVVVVIFCLCINTSFTTFAGLYRTMVRHWGVRRVHEGVRQSSIGVRACWSEWGRPIASRFVLQHPWQAGRLRQL
jgi:hypothetical protein